MRKSECKREEFRSFTDKEIVPYADEFDKLERTPDSLIQKFGALGYLNSGINYEKTKPETDIITYGILCEETGRASASLLSLLTVHGMVSQAVLKWGNSMQKECWLERLTSGKVIGAFGLSEPSIGSDAKNINTTAIFSNNCYILSGTKKWISFGQVADLFLILAQLDGSPTAFLLERNTPGFSIIPIRGMLGFKSAMLAELHFDKCTIPEENIIGRPGFGFSHVVATALDFGRYSIAWGAVGVANASLEASIKYTSERKQFGCYLKKHQLIQQMIADMVTNITAARLLCYNAGLLKNSGDPESIMETSKAKYFASKTAARAAANAVQIHGAIGCCDQYPVQRYFRDAKIMEIIEGSNQIQQILISRYAYSTLNQKVMIEN